MSASNILRVIIRPRFHRNEDIKVIGRRQQVIRAVTRFTRFRTNITRSFTRDSQLTIHQRSTLRTRNRTRCHTTLFHRLLHRVISSTVRTLMMNIIITVKRYTLSNNCKFTIRVGNSNHSLYNLSTRTSHRTKIYHRFMSLHFTSANKLLRLTFSSRPINLRNTRVLHSN